MADSVVSLYNMALGNIGSTQLVNDVADTTKVAVQCGTFYPTARDLVLRAAPWGFASRYVALAQIPWTTYQPVGWVYAYALPSDCVKALEIINPCTRQPSADARIPFALAQGPVAGGGGTKALLLTDLEPAAAVAASSSSPGRPATPTLKYISRVTDVAAFTPDVDLAIAWRLAALLAMPLAMAKEIKQAAEQMAASTLGLAVANALNEEQADPPIDSSFQSAREQ